MEVDIMNADGTGRIQLTNHIDRDLEPCWSPDGTKIAFYSYRDGDAEIYVIDANGANPTRLTFVRGKDFFALLVSRREEVSLHFV